MRRTRRIETYTYLLLNNFAEDLGGLECAFLLSSIFSFFLHFGESVHEKSALGG